MRIVIIGGNGLIGTKPVNKLRERGPQIMAASPGTDINTIAGEGLAQAFVSPQVVVDVANATFRKAGDLGRL
ncbi:hypothetical protein KDH_65650 [Dictyobacter sp. S3.2.2.5]|uniref:NAD-dependent epimerase/dehydratase domain-containing protein n=1 Tax=Dictyobacter halimunensis TaxID=3026934 RepID=A0ABQ6G3S2_9CHLR|nr:hypothetical protein KDH_65650 [Dictyobacter sp. S3.2.2.5]